MSGTSRVGFVFCFCLLCVLLSLPATAPAAENPLPCDFDKALSGKIADARPNAGGYTLTLRAAGETRTHELRRTDPEFAQVELFLQKKADSRSQEVTLLLRKDNTICGLVAPTIATVMRVERFERTDGGAYVLAGYCYSQEIGYKIDTCAGEPDEYILKVSPGSRLYTPDSDAFQGLVDRIMDVGFTESGEIIYYRRW